MIQDDGEWMIHGLVLLGNFRKKKHIISVGKIDSGEEIFSQTNRLTASKPPRFWSWDLLSQHGRVRGFNRFTWTNESKGWWLLSEIRWDFPRKTGRNMDMFIMFAVFAGDFEWKGCSLGNILCWLVVWTPLKNISQLGWLFPIYGKIKHVPNHQPVMEYYGMYQHGSFFNALNQQVIASTSITIFFHDDQWIGWRHQKPWWRFPSWEISMDMLQSFPPTTGEIKHSHHDHVDPFENGTKVRKNHQTCVEVHIP